MNHSPLFSVVILHYNQPQYLFTAVESVLAQSYPNIELIVADDSSVSFDTNVVEKHLRSKSYPNLKDYKIYSNECNLGTVKNLNRAIETAQGEYILFFAADDALYDSTVLEKFAAGLEALSEKELCVSAQCVMMDQELKEKLGDFTDINRAAQLNELGSDAQFLQLMSSAFYGMGSSAFRRKDFLTIAKFDERYVLVEDWSFFLSQTRAGRPVRFVNFYALKHREGGVSHNLCPVEPAYVRVFKDDVLRINENEILPYLRRLPLAKQVKVLGEYEAVRTAYKAQYGEDNHLPKSALLRLNPKLYLRKALWRLMALTPVGVKRCFVSLLMFFVLWILTGSLGIQFTQNMVTYFGMIYSSVLVLILVRWVFPALLLVSVAGFAGFSFLWLYSKMKAWLR